MGKWCGALWTLLLLLPLGGLSDLAPAHVANAAPPPCSTSIAVLGADLTPAGRLQVEKALGVGPTTRVLPETVADEGSTADDLVPPALLGRYAISSALLRLMPAGAGLHVTLNPNVTLYTAQAYANALLTAGVVNASVAIAAPSAQRALGTTALLSLLRAARLSCIASTVTPLRQHLALREFILTYDLAAGMGYTAAPRFMAALKTAVAGERSPATLAGSVQKTSAALHLTIPATVRQPLITFLTDLAQSGVYMPVAHARPSIKVVSPSHARVSLHATPQPAPRGGLAQGVVVSLKANRLAVRQRDGIHQYKLAPSIAIVRAGVSVTTRALVPGAAVQVDYDGMATRITVAAPSNRSTPPLAPRTVQGTLAKGQTGAASLTVRTTGGLIDTRPAPNVLVYRNGLLSGLRSLQAGDSLTVTVNGQGEAIHIDALGAPASPGASTIWPAMAVVLGAILLLLALLLLLLFLLFPRRRSGRQLAPAGAPRGEATAVYALFEVARRGREAASSCRPALAEAIGACFLTLAALLGQTPVAVAVTLAAFVYVLGDISGCHLNPAVTLGLASARRLPVRTAFVYIIAQLAGAALARVLAPQVAPLAGHYSSGTVVGEFLGFGFLMLTVVAVSDKYVPRSGSGVAIGAALLAGLLVSRGIINPAIALAMGRLTSPASWAPLAAAVVFTGLFLLVAPHTQPDVADSREDTPVRRSA